MSAKGKQQLLEGINAVPAVKTVVAKSQELLDENAAAIRDLKHSLRGDAASREKLLKLTANLTKIKAMYDGLLDEAADDGAAASR